MPCPLVYLQYVSKEPSIKGRIGHLGHQRLPKKVDRLCLKSFQAVAPTKEIKGDEEDSRCWLLTVVIDSSP